MNNLNSLLKKNEKAKKETSKEEVKQPREESKSVHFMINGHNIEKKFTKPQ